MDSERSRRERLAEIRGLLATESIQSQEELVARLSKAGFTVTQSAISRDLRELGVAKRSGVYTVLVGSETTVDGPPLGSELLLNTASAGANLLVLHTAIGAASRVALALDQGHWPEIVGTIAGDDTVFVATTNDAGQQRTQKKLLAWIQGGSDV